jgi:hypothetical protein
MRSKRLGFWRNVALESGDFASVGFMKKKADGTRVYRLIYAIPFK